VVRSLADESFAVVVVEDCCAAATMHLHRHELEVINMIHCHVAALDDVLGFFARDPRDCCQRTGRAFEAMLSEDRSYPRLDALGCRPERLALLQ
jgi:hypothetical protein